MNKNFQMKGPQWHMVENQGQKTQLSSHTEQIRTGGDCHQKQCDLVTCLRSVRLSVCVRLGGGSRGILSESEWLWGLMGLKRSVGTVSCWENSSGCERTEPLEPAHKQGPLWIWRGNNASWCGDPLRKWPAMTPVVSLGVIYLKCNSVSHLIGPCGCPACAGAPASVLEAVLEPRGQGAAGGGTCSCRWAGSVCVPPQASWRSAGFPPVAPQDRAALAGEREERVRVPLELEGLGLLFYSSTVTLDTQREQRGSDRQHTQKTDRIFACWSWLAQSCHRSQKQDCARLKFTSTFFLLFCL